MNLQHESCVLTNFSIMLVPQALLRIMLVLKHHSFLKTHLPLSCFYSSQNMSKFYSLFSVDSRRVLIAMKVFLISKCRKLDTQNTFVHSPK